MSLYFDHTTYKKLKCKYLNFFFSQSSEIKLIRPNVTIHDAGAYACVAQNVAGKSESITNVTIISKTYKQNKFIQYKNMKISIELVLVIGVIFEDDVTLLF